MARFGKQAELEEQKSMESVECLVSVSDDNVSTDMISGETRYYVEVQRLQDQVSEDDAKDGLADSNPYITNMIEYYKDKTGKSNRKTSHMQPVSVYGMEQIKANAVNEYDTVKQVFNAVTGETSEKVVHNYIVKLNIGIDNKRKTAFFYVPKAVNRTDADKVYNERNMPKPGRELTQDIIDKHNEITRLSKEFYKNVVGKEPKA